MFGRASPWLHGHGKFDLFQFGQRKTVVFVQVASFEDLIESPSQWRATDLCLHQFSVAVSIGEAEQSVGVFFQLTKTVSRIR